MAPVPSDLAAGVSAYLVALREHDVPYELAEILVRDWHTARLSHLYGLATTPLTTMSATAPPDFDSEQIAEQVLRILQQRTAMRNKERPDE